MITHIANRSLTINDHPSRPRLVTEDWLLYDVGSLEVVVDRRSSSNFAVTVHDAPWLSPAYRVHVAVTDAGALRLAVNDGGRLWIGRDDAEFRQHRWTSAVRYADIQEAMSVRRSIVVTAYTHVFGL